MKILTNILASFFSVLLVIALIVAPLGSFATSFFEKSTVNEFVDSLNLREDLVDGITINGETNANFAKKIKSSKFYDKLFELCSDYITAPLYDSDTKISEKNVTDLADKHIDELSSIVTETIPDFTIATDEYGDSYVVSDGEIKDKVRSAIADVAPSIISELKEIRKNSNIGEIADTIKMIKTIHTVIFIAVIALTLIVFACTFRKLNGFIWLAVDYAVAALLTFALSGIVKNTLNGLISEIKLAEYLKSIRTFITNKLDEIYGDKIVLYIIIAAICLLIAIIYKVYRVTSKFQHKKATKPEKAAPQGNNTNAGQYSAQNTNIPPYTTNPYNNQGYGFSQQQNNPYSAQNNQNNYQNNYQNTQFTEPAPKPKDYNPYAPELPSNND